MPGSNAGTGQPISFRCTKCRSTLLWDNRDDGYRRHGWIDRVVLTGRKRLSQRGGIRASKHRREYRCLDCGHVGWSKHIDLRLKEKGSRDGRRNTTS